MNDRHIRQRPLAPLGSQRGSAADAASKPSKFLQTIALAAKPGIIQVVSKWLNACKDEGLEIAWHNGQCRARTVGSKNAFEGPIEVSLSRAALRGAIARIAALCNERAPGSVSTYGGTGELTAGRDRVRVYRATFTNTQGEHHLQLTRSPFETAAHTLVEYVRNENDSEEEAKEFEDIGGGLGELLRDSDPGIRQAAEIVVPALIDRLNRALHGRNAFPAPFRSHEGETRLDDAVVPCMIGLLGHPNAHVRRAGADVLGKLGSGAASAVVRLAKLLRDRNPTVAGEAAKSLGEIGQAAKVAVDQLVRALDHKSSYVRRHAAWALWKIGPAALIAVDKLWDHVKNDQDKDARGRAAWSLVYLLGENLDERRFGDEERKLIFQRIADVELSQSPAPA